MNYYYPHASPQMPQDRYYYEYSSPHSADYVQYVPGRYDTTPTKSKHSRTRSYAESPKNGGWHRADGAPPSYYEAYGYHTPRKETYVSYETRRPPPAYNMSSDHARYPRKHPQHFPSSEDEVEEPLPRYVREQPKSKSPNKHGKNPSADYSYYHQDQVYEETPKRSRARANTGTPRSTPKHKSTPSRSVPVATEKDALRAGIPAGYSIKNWDPTEKPIILLGSVFDANSLGKWIYDWTVFHHGASTPMADMAGDLWLLLIKLAGKMKRAEECVRRVRNVDNQDMIRDFLTSGSRLWEKFKSLLKDCEYYMMKVAKREGGKTMGKNAGTEFVDSIFGRERYLEHAERIMANVRLWNMRFDVNCEEILRRPSAA